MRMADSLDENKLMIKICICEFAETGLQTPVPFDDSSVCKAYG